MALFIGSNNKKGRPKLAQKCGRTWEKTSWFSQIWIWAIENSENCGQFWRHGSHVDNLFLKIYGVYPHISPDMSGGNLSIPTLILVTSAISRGLLVHDPLKDGWFVSLCCQEPATTTSKTGCLGNPPFSIHFPQHLGKDRPSTTNDTNVLWSVCFRFLGWFLCPWIWCFFCFSKIKIQHQFCRVPSSRKKKSITNLCP